MYTWNPYRELTDLVRETFNDKSFEEICETVEWLQICGRECYKENVPLNRHGDTILPEEVFFSVNLYPGYTKEQLAQVLKEMSVFYYAGYGSQCIYGIVKFKDGSWMTRWEYDGSEGWEECRVPTPEDYFHGISKQD